MKTYLITPRDRLVLRDGAGAEGNTMRTLPFPWPSSTAGLVRSLAGSDADGRFTGDAEKLLKEVKVRGPWLCEESGREVYLPAPADQVLLRSSDGAVRWQLRPSPQPEDILVDSGLSGLEMLVLPPGAAAGKPAPAPRYWSGTTLQAWLEAPQEKVFDAEEYEHWREGKSGKTLPALPVERRTHVGIDGARRSALDGALFSTDGLRFPTSRTTKESLGLLLHVTGANLTDGLVNLGGERTVTTLRQLNEAQDGLGTLPATVPESVKNAAGRRRRLILTTPAELDGGSLPKDGKLLGAKVVAAAVGRPETISGWDFKERKPKPSRRLVPAGSVFWVEIPDGQDAAAWCQKAWLSSVSTNEQARRDGFGICLVGVAP